MNNSLPVKCLHRDSVTSCTMLTFLNIVTDVLLHFVQHDQGREIATVGQGFGDGVDHLHSY